MYELFCFLSFSINFSPNPTQQEVLNEGWSPQLKIPEGIV